MKYARTCVWLSVMETYLFQPISVDPDLNNIFMLFFQCQNHQVILAEMKLKRGKI